MTFLEPALLAVLPVAALPVVIHLVHLYRRRQVRWAAMMFLLAAQQMNKGLSRLKQILILALRVASVAAIIFTITRPLSGGWLGLTGGAPDTVLVLLDRSASMEQHTSSTSLSKREAGLRNVSKAIQDALGNRSKIVLIDSASQKPLSIDKASTLLDLPQTEHTDTAADIPGLLQNALDYITTNKTGRSDIWVISDLQKTDWDRSDGRWETLRAAFKTLPGVHFHLLTSPQPPPDDFAIRLEHVTRQESAEKAALLFDIRISRNTEHPTPLELPLRFVINGIATTSKVTIQDSQLVLQAFSLPIEKSLTRGWGKVELPADSNPTNNVFHFAFAEAPILRSTIVAEATESVAPTATALNSPADTFRKYSATILPIQRAAEIPWDETGLLIWQGPLPKPDDPLLSQIQEHVASGRSAIFFPPNSPDNTELFGLHWDQWETLEKPLSPEWWRNDSDLLANTRDGSALPIGTLEVSRFCSIAGAGTPLARLPGHGPLLLHPTGIAGVTFIGTLPDSGSSSLARDGIVLYVAMHRALGAGSETLGTAQQRSASSTALPGDRTKWQSAGDQDFSEKIRPIPGTLAGVVESDKRMIALNRPVSEDECETISEPVLKELFAGLDFRILKDSLEDGKSLTNEVWRTFLFAMALALLGETLLCLPPRRDKTTNTVHSHRSAFGLST